MLDGDRRMLGVGHLLAASPGRAAELPEDQQIVDAGTDYTCVRPSGKFGHEGPG